MDKTIAAKLNPEHPLHSTELDRKLRRLAADYVQAGLNTLNYYVADMDAANDMVQCYAPLRRPTQDNLDRTAPDRFIHPMASTEITTLSTFISQILFGGATTRKVEPRNDEDEQGAKLVNQLLQWNDDQQATYLQGYLWTWDSLTFNRGVMYEYWRDIEKVTLEEVQEPDPDDAVDEQGNPVTYSRWRKRRIVTGGYNHVHLVSPYDFYSDPMLPFIRFQEGRFAGHRVMLPWLELKERSELDPTDYRYVLPHTVERLKNRPNASGTNVGSQQQTSRSRSYYERMRRGSSPATFDGTSNKVNKEDGGIVECFATIIKATPKSIGLFDDESYELIEILSDGRGDVLSVNILPNAHDQFPYAVGEARPHAHFQFSNSWALQIKPLQDYVDYLQNRRKESLSRTTGNIFIGDPTKVDFEAFTDPDKDGLFIPIKEEAMGQPLSSIIQQVAVNDTTANFHREMEMWINHAETTTGAHAFMQGNTENTSQTATQFAGVQQMGTGRISSVARILSVQAITPQTKRFVMNFQQFMPEEVVVRISGDEPDFDPVAPPAKYQTIKKADIQSEYDYIPHDGSLPGTDAKKVAALSRAVEVFAGNPAFATFFDNTVPGNLDGKQIILESLKASGMRLSNFLVTDEKAKQNLMQKQMAAGGGMGMPPQGVPPEMMGAVPTGEMPQMDTGAGNIPSAGVLPTPETAAPVGPSPTTI